MFLLPRDEIPEAPDALAQAIEEGLRNFVSRPDKMVVVRGADASALASPVCDLGQRLRLALRHRWICRLVTSFGLAR